MFRLKKKMVQYTDTHFLACSKSVRTTIELSYYAAAIAMRFYIGMRALFWFLIT